MNRTILIADDHELFRAGLKEMLRQKLQDWNIRETNSFGTALQAIKEDPQILMALVDLRMPGMTGPQSLETLVQARRDIPIIVLTASSEPADMRQCLRTGIMGYIPKNETASVIMGAIQLVLSGGVYVPPALLDFMEPVQQPKGLRAKLTPKQQQIFDLLNQGKTNKEIARDLSLSESTVKVHLASILKALGVRNRTQAVLYSENQ